MGKTPHTTISRREYVSAKEIIKEVEGRLKTGIKPDWLTFSGSGEPTLNSGIGEIIKGIREITDIPICVLTNGTLLWDPQVRMDIINADAVMPSLDSAIEKTFLKVCQPHPDLKIESVIDGLVDFRKVYRGKIWLEILLVEGLNDSPEELEALRKAAERISPDSIQLNTVVRPPAEIDAKPVSRERLEKIKEFFGKKAEIIASFKNDGKKSGKIKTDDVLEYLKRRPGSVEDISEALCVKESCVEKIFENLKQSGKIRINEFFGKRFCEYIDN